MTAEHAGLKAKCNGGLPQYPIVVDVPGGDVVIWEPSGEVRTLIRARKPEKGAAA